MESSYCKRLKAEFIGTFTLIFVGCGAAVIGGPSIGNMGVALAFGLALVALMYAFGSVSGCHLNPALTLAMLISKRIKLEESIGYILVQVIGGILAACLIGAIYGFKGIFGQNMIMSPYTMQSVMIAEIAFTFLFVYVFLAVTKKTGEVGFGGLAVGLTLLVLHLVGLPIDGLSINPARSTGPALLAGGEALSQLWIFWLAPVIGALLAAFFCRYMCCDKK